VEKKTEAEEETENEEEKEGRETTAEKVE